MPDDTEARASRRLPLPPRDDIRLAEAARILGVLPVAELPSRALEWLDGGIDSPNVRSLAGFIDGEGVTDGVRLALMAEIASDLGIRFATVQDARSLHAEHLVLSMTAGGNVSPDIFALSNGMTDELTGRLSRFLGRLLGREPLS